MLDPEQVNLVDFEKCTFDKFLDSYGSTLNSDSNVDTNLCQYVRTKFHLEADSISNI